MSNYCLRCDRCSKVLCVILYKFSDDICIDLKGGKVLCPECFVQVTAGDENE